MSLYDDVLHTAGRHGDCMLYSVHDARICLRCLFEALSSDRVLESRRLFLLRRFAELEGPGGEAQRTLLSDACGLYPDYVLDHVIAAIAIAADPALCQALQQLSILMGSLSAFFRDALTGSLAAAIADPSAAPDDPSDIARFVSACLELLSSLCSAPGGCHQLLVVANTSQPFLDAFLGSLACGDAAVMRSSLRLLTVLLGQGCSQLQAPVQEAVFLCLADSLGHLPAGHDLQLMSLECLRHVAVHGSISHLFTLWLQDVNGNLSAAGSSLLQGLRGGLLSTDIQVQLAAAELVVALGSASASPQLLTCMLHGDIAEHLFEAARASLQRQQQQQRIALGQDTGMTAAGKPSQASQPSCCSALPAHAAHTATTQARSCDAIQLACVAALRRLSTQGQAFLVHFQFGVESVALLVVGAASAGHHQLLACALELLLDAGATEGWLGTLPRAVLVQLAKAAAAALLDLDDDSPAPATPSAGGGLLPSEDLGVALVAACRLLQLICRHSTAHPASWSALRGVLLSAGRRAACALPVLSAPALAQGYLPACCSLLEQVARCVREDAGNSAPQARPHHLQPPEKPRPGNQLAERLLQRRGAQPAASPQHASACNALDDLTGLLDSAARHVLPALCVVLDSQLQATAGRSSSPVLAGGSIDMAVHPALTCILTLLHSGDCHESLRPAVDSVVDLLLNNFHWIRSSLQALPVLGQGVARTAAWELLLWLAARADELRFLADVLVGAHQLALELDELVGHSSCDLLHVLLPAPSSTLLSPVQRAVLALLSASCRCGGLHWPSQDVLAHLDLLAQHHPAALQHQPALLYRVVHLYAAVEQQAADDAWRHGQPPAGVLLQAPPGIVSALLRADGWETMSHPATAAGRWVLSKAAAAPGLAGKLLHSWVHVLLAAADREPPQPAPQQPPAGAACHDGTGPPLHLTVQTLVQDVCAALLASPQAMPVLLAACSAAHQPVVQQACLWVVGTLLHGPPAAAHALLSSPAPGDMPWGQSMVLNDSGIEQRGALHAAEALASLTQRLLMRDLWAPQQAQPSMCGATCCTYVLHGLAAAAACGALGVGVGRVAAQEFVGCCLQQVHTVVPAVNHMPQPPSPLQQHCQLLLLEAINSLVQASEPAAQPVQHLCSVDGAQLAEQVCKAACAPPQQQHQQQHGAHAAAMACGSVGGVVEGASSSSNTSSSSSSQRALEALMGLSLAAPGGGQPLPAPLRERQLLAVLQWHHSCLAALASCHGAQRQAGAGVAAPWQLISPLCSHMQQQQEQQQQQQQQQELGAVFHLGMAELLVMAAGSRVDDALRTAVLRSVRLVLARILRLALQQQQQEEQEDVVGRGGPATAAACSAGAAGPPEASQQQQQQQQRHAPSARCGGARVLLSGELVELALCVLQNLAAGSGSSSARRSLRCAATAGLAALLRLLAAAARQAAAWGVVVPGAAAQRALTSPRHAPLLRTAVDRLCAELAALQLLLADQQRGACAEATGSQEAACDDDDDDDDAPPRQQLLQCCNGLVADGCLLVAALASASASPSAAIQEEGGWCGRAHARHAAAAALGGALQLRDLAARLCWAAAAWQEGEQQQQQQQPAAFAARLAVAAVSSQLLLALLRAGLLAPHVQLCRKLLLCPHQQQQGGGDAGPVSSSEDEEEEEDQVLWWGLLDAAADQGRQQHQLIGGWAAAQLTRLLRALSA